MVRYGFKARPKITRIFGNNIGLQQVLKKAGFTLEASLTDTICKHGRAEDELIYRLRRSEIRMK